MWYRSAQVKESQLRSEANCSPKSVSSASRMSSYTHLPNLAASVGVRLASPQPTGLLSSFTQLALLAPRQVHNRTRCLAQAAPHSRSAALCLRSCPSQPAEIDCSTREPLFIKIYSYNSGAGSIRRLRY